MRTPVPVPPRSVGAMRVPQLVVRASRRVEPSLVPRSQLSKTTPHGSESAGLRRRLELLSPVAVLLAISAAWPPLVSRRDAVAMATTPFP